MISKELSDISSDKEHLDKTAPILNEALKNCGFNETLNVSPTRRHAKRNIIWFNPPFRNNVKANVGKLILTLLQMPFPRHHKYYIQVIKIT